jgi:hypothetical protein
MAVTPAGIVMLVKAEEDEAKARTRGEERQKVKGRV